MIEASSQNRGWSESKWSRHLVFDPSRSPPEECTKLVPSQRGLRYMGVTKCHLTCCPSDSQTSEYQAQYYYFSIRYAREGLDFGLP